MKGRPLEGGWGWLPKLNGKFNLVPPRTWLQGSCILVKGREGKALEKWAYKKALETSELGSW